MSLDYYRDTQKMTFAMLSKQVTVVYAKEYVSAANVIENQVQAFVGFKSRLWEVEDYVANKYTLDSDELVLFLGDFEENVAAKTYAKTFAVTENVGGCVYSIAGSKALIYATDEVAAAPHDGAAHFYSDSDGNTRTQNHSTTFTDAGSSVWRTAAKLGLGGVGGWLVEKLLPEQSVPRQQQLEAGCEAFMARNFARWVNYKPD